MSQERIPDDKQTINKPEKKQPPRQHAPGVSRAAAQMMRLQQQVGNRAVQRLLAQRSAEEGFDLDDDTASRIESARGGGHSLDNTVQKQMGDSMGHDFSGVRVHTSSESDALNQDLGAKAFTTGNDIFFKRDAYDPGSSGGQELIAHELTHVVQQSTGQVPSSGDGMTVRPANDSFEQEADSMAAEAITQTKADPAGQAVQRQEEEELQMKRDDIQRQEEEEELQMKRDDIQRQEEEEELQMKQDDIQRQDEEEEMM